MTDRDETEWDSNEYDEHHSFVFEHGEDVIDLLEPTPDERILDLGCGTGHLTAAIAGAVEDELERRGYESTHPWYFPSVGEYASRLESHGFEVRHARLFDRPTTLDDGDDGLAAWLEMFGDELLSAVPEHDRSAVIAAVEDDLRDEYFADGTWTADYRRLRIVAVTQDA